MVIKSNWSICLHKCKRISERALLHLQWILDKDGAYFCLQTKHLFSAGLTLSKNLALLHISCPHFYLNKKIPSSFSIHLVRHRQLPYFTWFHYGQFLKLQGLLSPRRFCKTWPEPVVTKAEEHDCDLLYWSFIFTDTWKLIYELHCAQMQLHILLSTSLPFQSSIAQKVSYACPTRVRFSSALSIIKYPFSPQRDPWKRNDNGIAC